MDGITATGGGGAVPSVVVVVVVVAARDRFLGSDGPVSSSFSLALLVDILRFLFWICASPSPSPSSSSSSSSSSFAGARREREKGRARVYKRADRSSDFTPTTSCVCVFLNDDETDDRIKQSAFPKKKKKKKKKKGGLLTARLFFFWSSFWNKRSPHFFPRERERETLCALFILGHGDHRIRSREHSHLEAC